MSDEEIDLTNIPDRDTCQKRTEDFAEITKTNEALAQTFLQDHEWDLGKSITAYYDALYEETQRKSVKRKAEDNESSTSGRVVQLKYANDDLYNPNTVQKLFGEGKTVTNVPPPTLKFMTWNLDGLDEKNLKKRTRFAISLVQKNEPDIIFFQEVISETADYFERKLPEYRCIRGGDGEYFTMTLLRVFTIFYDKHYIIEYPGTVMNRNLLVTEAHMGKLKLQLLNTHLESTADYAEERMQQLKLAFDRCSDFSSDYTVIFAGDLNMRDREERIPKGFFDLWEYCGSPKEFKYTWDMSKNTNLTNFGKFKPKCRFDRVYYRFSEPKRAEPKGFALIGFEKVPETQSFVSDHWGIVVFFDLNHSV